MAASGADRAEGGLMDDAAALPSTRSYRVYDVSGYTDRGYERDGAEVFYRGDRIFVRPIPPAAVAQFDREGAERLIAALHAAIADFDAPPPDATEP